VAAAVLTKVELSTLGGTPYSCPTGQLYGLPRGILGVFSTILYKHECQNPQIVQQTISLFPEQSTLTTT
jgi:hypothetical protein